MRFRFYARAAQLAARAAAPRAARCFMPCAAALLHAYGNGESAQVRATQRRYASAPPLAAMPSRGGCFYAGFIIFVSFCRPLHLLMAMEVSETLPRYFAIAWCVQSAIFSRVYASTYASPSATSAPSTFTTVPPRVPPSRGEPLQYALADCSAVISLSFTGMYRGYSWLVLHVSYCHAMPDARKA